MNSNAEQIAVDLVALGLETTATVRKAVTDTAADLQGLVKKRAMPRSTPRPGPRDGSQGPRLVTGDFERTVNRTPTRQEGMVITAEVGTDAPQGARLEFGFVGTDSLGRVFDQQAYPSFGPALDEVAPRFEAAIAAAVAEAIQP